MLASNLENTEWGYLTVVANNKPWVHKELGLGGETG